MAERPTPERIEYLRRTSRMQIGSPESIARGLVQEQQELLAEIDALREQITAANYTNRCAMAALSENIDRLTAERDAAIADAKALAGELSNIANAKRHDRRMFDNDESFADWAQSRARHTISRHGGGA